MKLVLTVLLLIVLPTALLSLLAGHSLQAREYLLERQLEQEALQHLEQVGNTILAAVDAEHAQVKALFSASILSGGDIRRFPQQAAAHRAQAPLARRLFLFMNPWGFIYPEEAASGGSDPMRNEFVVLQQALTTRISTERKMDGFWAGAHLYHFGPHPAEPGLYAGFELDTAEVVALVEQTLQAYSTGYLEYVLLQVTPFGDSASNQPEHGIQVVDSLSAQPEPLGKGSTFIRERNRYDALVAGRLRAPFDTIEIGAYAVNAAAMRRAQTMQLRLFQWGILLLAIAITTSTVMLILLARRQAEAARRRGVFMAGVSHDIRTPVAGVRALAESMRAGRVSSPERQQQFLDTIVQECDRLSRLIDRVLLFFRQEQRSARYRKDRVDLERLCAGVIERFAIQHRDQVDVSLQADGAPNAAVWGDHDALEQVIYNLVDNARKYGRPPDQPHGAVRIRMAVSRVERLWRHWVVVSVADEGPGVSGTDRRRIFQRFYRGQSAGDAHTGGIGLGLALVREILRVHHARIYLKQDKQQGGAAFELWFRAASKADQ